MTIILFRPGVVTSISVDEFPVNALKSSVDAWFGAPSGLNILQEGDITGRFVYRHEGSNPPSWSGQFQFANATLTPPGLAAPLDHSEGRVNFDDSSLDLTHFSTTIGDQSANISYHYLGRCEADGAPSAGRTGRRSDGSWRRPWLRRSKRKGCLPACDLPGALCRSGLPRVIWKAT